MNQIALACGEFDLLDSQGALLLDWYDRAAKAFGTDMLNAFTRLRELLKAVIALHVLPSTINKGEVPAEIASDFGQWLKSIFADKSVAAEQRWCSFLNGLQEPPPEFGGLQPTAPGKGRLSRDRYQIKPISAIARRSCSTSSTIFCRAGTRNRS